MKGIILAGGAGTRLYPATFPVSKILLPVYDRPMIYYPLATLMQAGIRDILVITNVADHENFRRALGDGSQFGVRIQYDIQKVQRGIADAFIIAKDFIGDDRVALILGDNIFHGNDICGILEESADVCDGAVVFGYRVPDPERFGVVGFDEDMNATSLEEKPKSPKSDYAVVGLYFYGPEVCGIADGLEPSDRGELEVTDLNKVYLNEGRLSVRLFGDDVSWVDAGTFSSLLDASTFIRDEEARMGRKILCPETIAYEKGFISREELMSWLDRNKRNEYFNAIRAEVK